MNKNVFIILLSLITSNLFAQKIEMSEFELQTKFLLATA
jgi:hypothetical protein